MKTVGFKKRILSVFIVFLFMIVLFCFSKESTDEASDEEKSIFLETEKENAALEGMNGENAFLTETEKNGKENVEKAEEGEEAEKDDEAEKADGEDIMGMAGIKYGKELSKEVIRALKKGDTEFLTGIAFGEEFDYDLYKLYGRDEYYAKETPRSNELHYFFDGKGHRFSGFSYDYVIGCEPFLGIEANDQIAILLEAFGIPDACEECMIWGKSGLRADWYFEKAVLTLYESNACVWKIEYKALGDAADGDGEEKKSDFERRMEHRSANEKAEVFYSWDYEAWEKDVSFGFPEDKNDMEAVNKTVEDYLREQGFEEKILDSVIYDAEGQKLGEVYTVDEKRRYCFIMYVNGGVTCAVRDIDEAVETGYLVYSCNEEGDVIQETQYDAWGMRMAEASYKYYDGVPFPFLTEDWNIGYYDSNNTCHLCRNQKTWFLEKNAGINDKGRVKTVSGNGISDMKVKSYFINFDKFTYRADGNLKAIREEIPTKYVGGLEEIRPDCLERPYFGEMEFQYDPGGTLKKIEYYHTDWEYGTWDQSGYIDFDKQGRMVHNHYYVTHGYHSKFFFYHEEEERPRAAAGWCWGYDFEDITVYRPWDES